MNTVRVPIVLLVVAVLAFGAWFFFVYQNSATTAPQEQAPTVDATTTEAVTIPTPPPTVNAVPALSEAAVATDMSGLWQSTDDPNYSVDITPDGTWTDKYKQASATSSITETGTYTFFTSSNPDPDFPGPLQTGVVYIKLVEGSDTYFYSVLEATNDQLQLSYLAQGETLSFVKEQ